MRLEESDFSSGKELRCAFCRALIRVPEIEQPELNESSSTYRLSTEQKNTSPQQSAVQSQNTLQPSDSTASPIAAVKGKTSKKDNFHPPIIKSEHQPSRRRQFGCIGGCLTLPFLFVGGTAAFQNGNNVLGTILIALGAVVLGALLLDIFVLSGSEWDLDEDICPKCERPYQSQRIRSIEAVGVTAIETTLRVKSDKLCIYCKPHECMVSGCKRRSTQVIRRDWSIRVTNKTYVSRRNDCFVCRKHFKRIEKPLRIAKFGGAIRAIGCGGVLLYPFYHTSRHYRGPDYHMLSFWLWWLAFWVAAGVGWFMVEMGRSEQPPKKKEYITQFGSAQDEFFDAW